ncbi:MAG: PQQ-binding-like beta-propeller repeat protein, partial [Planctomycetota bacterium]
MPHYFRRTLVARVAVPARGFLLLVVVGLAAVGAAQVAGPAIRPVDSVPATWQELKIDWKGSWDETLTANLDPAKNWQKTLEADESFRQAAGLIVRLREISLLEAMIAHFPEPQAKRQQAYIGIAQAYAGMGDRTRAIQWMRRQIADYPDQKTLAAEAFAAILRYSHPFRELPDARVWVEYAAGGLESLVKAGALPPDHPSVVLAREQLCNVLRYEQRPSVARRSLDSLKRGEGEKTWWRTARAQLLLAAGHIPQAAALYELAGNADYAKTLREPLRQAAPEVEVAPPPPGLEERLERLGAAISLTGVKALQNVEAVQDVLTRCADSGAIQTVNDSLQASSAAVLDRSLRNLKAELGPLRQWQQQAAKRLADTLPERGGEDELARLARRYPWAQRVQEVLVDRGEQALREGRGDWAAWAFESAAAHAEDPAVLAQARLGLWLAMAQRADGPEAAEQAMAQVPDATPMPWHGVAGTAAAAKAFVRLAMIATDAAPTPLPRAPGQRLQLPAPMAAHAPTAPERHESSCLGPWAIRRVESLDGRILVFGPKYVACYDEASMALRWVHAAPGADQPPAEEDPASGDASNSNAAPAWRPVALASANSQSAPGGTVYALLSRGGGGADLAALDGPTGRAIWTTRGRPEWDGLRILSEPAADQDRLYVLAMSQDLQGTCTPYLVCLAGDDARTLWKRRLGTTVLPEPQIAMTLFACGVAVHHGSVYVSTNMGILARCDARSGAVEWLRTYHAATPSEAAGQRARREGSTPRVAGERVFFAPRDHSGVMAVDRHTGQLAWESPLVPSDQIVGLVGQAMVVRDAGELAALDTATGEELWSHPVDSDAQAPALIAGRHVLVTAGDRLLRLAAETGQRIEEATAPRGIGAEHMLLPGGALVAVSEEPLLERTLAPEPVANPSSPPQPFTKRWALPCRDPLLVVAPASSPPADLVGVLSGTRFYCLRVRPACRLVWQMPFRKPPDSAGFHGRLVIFATGAELTGVDKETGAVRWRRTLPFAADLIAGDDRVLVAGRSSPEAPVMALSPETGAVLWVRWFGQERRFVDDRLRWLALTGEPGAPPVLRLYWGGALFAREGRRPAEALADPATGALREVHPFLPSEPQWPALIAFGDDTRTRPAADMGIPWPYRGPLRPDAVAYLGKNSTGRFALRDGGADLAGGWNPQADASLEAARRWAGLYATPAGAYVKRLGQLAFFDAQAKREVLFNLPRNAERKTPFAIGDFREDAGDKLTAVSVAPGRPYETGLAEGGPDNRVGKGQLEMMNLLPSDYTKSGLHDDAGNGDVTLIYYALGARSQVFFNARGLPEAGGNPVATLLNGLTGEYYVPQKLKMTGLASLGWAKYDVFLYGGGSKGAPAFD